MNQPYNILIDKLDKFIRKYYFNQLIKGGLYAIGLVISFFLISIVIEHFGQFTPAARTTLFYTTVLLICITVGRLIIYPITKLYNIGEIISHEEAAVIIGSHFTEIEDKLLNILQLKNQVSETENELAIASISQKSIELNPVPFLTIIDLKKNRKYLKYAGLPFVLFIILFYSSPQLVTQSANRLVHHTEHFDPIAPFIFEVDERRLTAVKHEDFNLEIVVNGSEVPENASIEIEDQKFRLKKSGVRNFSYAFKNIQEEKEFRIFSEGFYSKPFKIKVLPKPILLSFKVDIDYPDYVGKKDETQHNVGDMIIPEGTKIKWSFQTKDANTLLLSFQDSIVALSQHRKDKYEFSQRFFQNDNYFVSSRNEYMNSKDSVFYSINVVTDQYPDISVEERVDSLSSQRIYFRGEISDDYGLKQLTFNYKYVEFGEMDSIKTKELFSHDIPVNNGVQDRFFHYWDLSEMGINAGEEIEYYFEVWDNDQVNGSKSSRTKKMFFKAPTLEELSKKEAETNKNIKEKLEESIKEAKEIQKELEKFQKKLMEKKELTWADKKQLKELLEKQKALEENIEKAQRQNQKKINEQSQYKNEQKILEKQQQIQELFDEVMTEEMKEMYKELEEMMEKLSKEDLQEELEKMELSNEDVEKELDRTLELFKQMEFEQKLEETIDKLDEIKEEQEKLAKETRKKEKPQEDLKAKQEELNKKFDEIQEDIKDLEEKNDALEYSNDMPDMEEEQEEADEAMEKSSEELNQQQNKKASENQKNAANKMEEMADMMKGLQKQMEEEGYVEDINNLRQLLENLIQLSFDEEELMNGITGLQKKDPKYFKIGQQQKKLSDDAKMIEDSLFALSKRVPELESSINREINDINANIEKALYLIQERQTAQAKAKQQYVMTAVNNLALLLDEIIQQMQMAQAEQKFGEGSCSKPGSSGKPKPGQMKNMQKKISDQLKKMKEEMEGGKSPGGKQGKGMSKKLAQLAAEQEALRNEIQKLSDKLGEEKASGGNGTLKKLAELMEKNEKDIVNNKISQETIQRQAEIMTRLLEHEKAEREREFDDKREAKEANNEKISNPSEFFEYNRLKEKEAELLRTVPPSMNSFYKNKVNEYFNQID